MFYPSMCDCLFSLNAHTKVDMIMAFDSVVVVVYK